jgi:hypothetical protein
VKRAVRREVERFAAWVELTSALADGRITAEEYDRRLAELREVRG